VQVVTKNRIALVVLITAFAAAAGCQNSGQAEPSAARNPGTSSLAATHAAVSRLPAVKAIEKWENKYGDGLTITTEHYTIYTTLTDVLILRLVPAFVESAYEGYQSELPGRIVTQNTFEVYLFAKREQWEAFTDDFMPGESQLYKKIQKGAYCAKGACVAYYIGRNETFSAVGHEGWHQFCGRHFVYRLPSWLDEGIATLFETSSLKDGKWVFEPQVNLGRLGGLKRTMLNGKAMPLRNLLSLNPGEVIGGQDSTVAFYSQSYAMVRFLREEGYGKRLGRYHALLLGGLRGDWPLSEELGRMSADRNVRLTVGWNAQMGPALFEQFISRDWRQIEEEYMNFCRKITYHVRLRQVELPVDIERGN
jgi:hypothetical protein